MASAPIIIVGAGIGGLTAARALARKGFRVTLLERMIELEDIGAGLQLSPNATRVLLDLGLSEKLKSHAVAPAEVRIKTSNGKELARVPLGDFAERRYGAPYWVIHRADLQAVLSESVRAEPNIELMLGAEVEGFSLNGEGVSVHAFRNVASAGTGDETTFDIRGMALIGADGLNSNVRFGQSQTERRYSGRIASRATISADAVSEELREPVVHLWLGRSAHVVHYPVEGGDAVNIVAIGRDPQRSFKDLLFKFQQLDWARQVRELLAVPDRWLHWPLYDRPPMRRWGSGPVTLLGDAAHPMLPFLAQGAAMAIEDAAVLADCLHANPNEVARALRRYERRRQPRTSRVQRTARRNGLIYHLGGPAAAVRNYILRKKSGEPLLARFDWLYDWRPETDQG